MSFPEFLRTLKQWMFLSKREQGKNYASVGSLDRRQIALQQRERALTTQEIKEKLPKMGDAPLFSILIPVQDPPQEFLRQTLDSVLNQAYPRWELCIVNDASSAPYVTDILEEFQQSDSRIKLQHSSKKQGISAASNAALAMANGDFVCLVEHDDLLLHDTLFEIAEHILRLPEIDFIYTDSAIVDTHGKLVEFFYKPDFNQEMFLCQNWLGQLSMIRHSLLTKVGGWSEGRTRKDYDLFLRCIEQAGRVSHIHKILFYYRQGPGTNSVSSENQSHAQDEQRMALQDSLNRRKIEGTLSDMGSFIFCIQRPLNKEERVSVIICTLGWELDLPHVLGDFLTKKPYPDLEILLLMDPLPGGNMKNLEAKGVHFLKYEEAETLTANLNRVAESARGDHLLFVFWHFKPLTENWLLNLVEQSQRSESGLVAGKLLNRQHRIATAGGVLSRVGPLNLFQGDPSNAVGETNSLISPRSYQLLSGHCAMVAKPVFRQVEGFDTAYQSRFFDYDLCLRLEQKGYRNLFTPFTILQLQYNEALDKSLERDSEDFIHFHDKWESIFGKDGNFNFALQEALVERKDKR